MDIWQLETSYPDTFPASPRKKAYDPKNDTSVLLEKKKVETRPVEVETLES